MPKPMHLPYRSVRRRVWLKYWSRGLETSTWSICELGCDVHFMDCSLKYSRSAPGGKKNGVIARDCA